ncbi:6-bladed beta-propeller [candidate division KSB1 bacterium]
MKVKSVVVLLIFAVMLFSCGGQESGQDNVSIAPAVEVIDGVRHVHNFSPQWGNTPKVGLEFVRRIGGLDEQDEDRIMSKISDLALDMDGNIFILDTGSSRIQKFNAQGRFLRTFGGKGNGPGEFRTPVSLNINSAGRMTVGDSGLRHFIVLNADGREITRFKRKHSVQRTRLLSDNTLISGGFNHGFGYIKDYDQGVKDGYYDLFYIVQDDGTDTRSFGELDLYNDEETGEFYIHANVFFDVDSSGFVYSVHRYRDTIEKLDAAGNPVMVFDRPVNCDEIEFKFDYFMRMFHSKSVYSNSISTGVAVDGKDRIWIITVIEQQKEWRKDLMTPDQRQIVKRSHAKFEIFSNEGVLLGSLPLPEDTPGIRIFDDRLFLLDPDCVSVAEYRIIEK